MFIPDTFAEASEQIFVGSLFELLDPPEDLTYSEWVSKYRILTKDASEKPGKFDLYYTAYFLAMYKILDEPYKKHEIVWMKPAQFGFTEAENNLLGKMIHQRSGNIILSFPREASAKSYVSEKFSPLITGTPELTRIFSGSYGLLRQAWNQKRFPGGFIKFITIGSPSAGKSSSAPFVMQEEPDDVPDNVKGQGDGIDVIRQRLKTFKSSILLFGGTPTRAGESQVEEGYRLSKRGRYMTICHECNEPHELNFDNLTAPDSDETTEEDVHGYDVKKAYYLCPSCGCHWDFKQKNINVRNSVEKNFHGWVFDNPSSEVWGFRGSELLSPFAGSSFTTLLRTKLIAEAAFAQGRPGKLISFVNNSQGLPYSEAGILGDLQSLKDKALPYREGEVYREGLILTAGVDVQHNRFAIGIRAWGRNGCSWLVSWVEIFGNVKNPDDPVWLAMENYVFKEHPSELNTKDKTLFFQVKAMGIDSGDGELSALIYSWVSRMRAKRRPVMATKGASETTALREIYTIPNDSASEYKQSVASRYGVHVFIIGTNKAKADIYRRLTLDGTTDRMFTYKGGRDDYWDQLLSNVPLRRGKKLTYVLKSGHRDEALDCEVLCMHAAYSLHIFYWGEKQWDAMEQRLVAALQGPAKKPTPTPNTYGGY